MSASTQPQASSLPSPVAAAARRNRGFYQRYWAGNYARRQLVWREWWGEGYALARRWAGDLSGCRVLSLFSGDGDDALELRAAGVQVVAADFARSGLERLRGSGVLAVCGDAHRLPFRAGCFDRVFVVNGLCHTDKARVLAECRRILAPGGRILVIEAMRWPHVAVLLRWLDPFFWRAPYRHLSRAEIRRLVAPFGRVQERQLFLLSVLSVMLLRLFPGLWALRRLHARLMAWDRKLLQRFAVLRSIGYLSVLCLEA